MADKLQSDIDHLRDFVVAKAEDYFGCPISQVLTHEKNAWCNRNSTCKRQFDVLREALYVPQEKVI